MAGYTYQGQKPARRNRALEDHERAVIAAPDYYVVSLFLGTGKFDKYECETTELAYTKANEMAVGASRPVSIYAVKDDRAVLADMVQPKKG